MSTKLVVKVGENGSRLGESHPKAVLTDHEVELLFELRDQGWGYRKLAQKFEISKRSVRDMLSGRTRAVAAAGWRQVVCA